MDISPRERGAFTFGLFRLDPIRRTLLHNGQEVALTARLFDTLWYLVQNPERLVTRDELQSAVWGGRVVEDGNLQKAISELRKALQVEGATGNYFVTVPGRGFRFAAPVSFEPEPSVAGSRPGLLSIAGGPESSLGKKLTRSWRTWAAVGLGVLSLVVAGGVVWRFADRPPSFAPPPHSVAVLAFRNLSGDPGQEYFSDGISEQLIDSLGRIAAVHVAARQSAFSFKGKSVTIADIARLLNVGTVLEGSVRRNGQQLRITAQLIDAATGYQLWSHSYDRDQGDILKVQAEIAEAITTSLRVDLAGTDIKQLTLGNSANPKALDAYLRALTIRRANRPGANKQALAAFKEALALDPNFALAHTRLASLLTDMSNGLNEDTVDVTVSRSLAAEGLAEAELAVSLEPRLGVAHEAVAESALYRWQFVRADEEFSLALALAPEDGQINQRYAMFQMDLGHQAAGVAAAERSVELNPLSSHSYLALAAVELQARQPDDALVALSHAEQLGWDGTGSPLIAEAELEKGDMNAASRTCSAERDLLRYFCLAVADHALGKQNDAGAQLAKLRALAGDDAAGIYVEIYAQWGQLADAMTWLETAYRLRDSNLVQLKVDPYLGPIRNMARFKAIKQKMNFPP